MSQVKDRVGLYGKLAMLILQNATLSLFMKASTSQRKLDKSYSLPSAVFAAELVKFISCSFVLFSNQDIQILSWTHLKQASFDIAASSRGSAAFAVPAAVYVLQNLLQYLGSSYLDVASYQLLLQLKIFTAALWGYFLVGRTLSSLQWLGLCLAAVGVTASQSAIPGVEILALQGRTLGVLSMVAASMASGFAGVYTERLVKRSERPLLVCNAYMALYSLPITFLSAYGSEGTKLWQDGLFHDFNGVVWVCVSLQAVGGFLVSWCLKHADSNLKNVAVSSSILVASVAAGFVFDEPLTVKVFFGGSLVVTSVWVFLRGSRRGNSNETQSKV